jgi:hypothetical protein
MHLLVFLKAYILQKIPPGKWLGANVILWGIVTASTASLKSYRGLLINRILVGIFEAATAPCLMLITGDDISTGLLCTLILKSSYIFAGMWYTKPEAIRRFSIWYGSVGLAQIIGGVISWVN